MSSAKEGTTYGSPPIHNRLSRYDTMSLEDICALPVAGLLAEQAHCYLWVPNALLEAGLRVLAAWGFTYKTMLVWHKVRADGGSDGSGVGLYVRNLTEVTLFGVRGRRRALAPRSPAGERAGHPQAGALPQARRALRRRRGVLSGPYLELFARHPRPGWVAWGLEADSRRRPERPARCCSSVA